MATETVLDRFVTLFNFRTDTRGLQDLSSRVGAVSSQLRNLTQGVVGIGAAFATSQVVQKSASWDDALNRLTGVSFDAPAHAVEKFEQQALSLSETWGRSATEIISLQEELKRSGLGWEDVMTLTPTVLQLAIGNNLDYARSAEIVVQALNAYGRSAEDAIQVSDQLALAAAQLFPTTLAQMAPAVRVVAGLASSMNIPFERLISLIGLLRKSMPAEMAGTGLRAVLIEMQKDKTAGESGDVIKQLGLDWANLQKVVAKGDIEHALRMLRDANLTAAQAVSLFGAEGANAAIQMIKLVDEVSASETALNNAGGTTRKAAEAMETGVKDSLQNMTAAWERLVIYLGESGLAESLGAVSDVVVDMVDSFKDLPEPVQNAISQLAVFGPAATGLFGILRLGNMLFLPFLSFLRLVPPRAAAAAAATNAVNASMAATGPAATAAGFGVKAFGLRLLALGKIGVIALGILGLALALKKSFDIWQEYGPKPEDFDIKHINENEEPFETVDEQWKDAETEAELAAAERQRRSGFVPFRNPYVESGHQDRLAAEMAESGHQAGVAFGDGLVAGLNATHSEVAAAMDATAALMRGYLPGSDAKFGPLSDLTASGRALGDTFTAGVESSSQAIHDALSAALTLPVAPPPPAAAAGGTGEGGGGGGFHLGSLTVNVGDIRVESGDPEVIASDVGDAIGVQLRRVVEEFDTPRIA